jgi:hypothetical protein
MLVTVPLPPLVVKYPVRLPLARIPTEAWPGVHSDGVTASAVAVFALPVVLAVRVVGSCALVAVPLRFENDGCAQFALPLIATPVEKLFVPHYDGVAASAVAVAAFPVVL